MVTTRLAFNQSPDLAVTLSPVVEYALEELIAAPDDLGIPLERLPVSTAEAVDEIMLPQSPTRRALHREQQWGTSCAQTGGGVILQTCLSLAICPENLALRITALQPELPFYETPEGKEFAALAIVAMKGIADLARKVGMSYAQTQQLVLLLVTLGFMKRFRSGRRFIYGVPLSPYNPSPKEIHRRLESLLRDLDLEERSPSKAAREKRARFRRMVEMVKLRYEIRYGLVPDLDLSTELLLDQERAIALREIQAVLPAPARTLAMPEITRIVVRRLVGKNSRESFSTAHPGVSVNHMAASNGERVVESLPVAQQRRCSRLSDASGETRVEQRALSFDEEIPLTPPVGAVQEGGVASDISAKGVLSAATPELVPQVDENVATRLPEQNDADLGAQKAKVSVLPSAESADDAVTTSYRAQISEQDVHALDGSGDFEETEYRSELSPAELAEQADILALVLEEDWTEVTVDGKKQRVSWVEVNEGGETVRVSCADPDVKLKKAGCHRAILRKTDPMIAKAAFAYTLWWARLGKVKKSRPAFFKSICERWMRDHNHSYEEACKANTRSRGTSLIRGGVGVPRQVRKIMSLFGHCSYEELSLLLERCTDEELRQLTENGVPPVFAWSSSSLAAVEGTVSARDEWLMGLLPLGEKRNLHESGMPERDAQALMERIAVEMPKAQPKGMREANDHTFSVLVALRGVPWEVCSEEEWDSYQEKLQRIKQLKLQLKQRKQQTDRNVS